MDLLYSRYASPMDLMNMYINRGRFEEFVKGVIESEYERKKEQLERDDELKLWMMYVHSFSDESFNDWKNRVLRPVNSKGKSSKDEDLTDDDILAILNDLFPPQ